MKLAVVAYGLSQLRAEPGLVAPWTSFVDSALREPRGVRVFDGGVYVAESGADCVTKWPDNHSLGGAWSPRRFPDLAVRPRELAAGTAALVADRWSYLGDAVVELKAPVDVALLRLDSGARGCYVAEAGGKRVSFWEEGEPSGFIVAGWNTCDREDPPRMMHCRRRGKALSGQDLDLYNFGNISAIDVADMPVDVASLLAKDKPAQQVLVYVSDMTRNRVTRWRQRLEGSGWRATYWNREKPVDVVAGGEGAGNLSTQLQGPRGIAVDADRSLYVADSGNHRVVRWDWGATEGVVVAGAQPEAGHGRRRRRRGNYIVQSDVTIKVKHPEGRCCLRSAHLEGLNGPTDVALHNGTLYIADYGNHRIVRWVPNATAGTLFAKVDYPVSVDVDPNGTVFVVDGLKRLQQFASS